MSDESTAAIEAINAYVSEHVEYETSHIDAGNGYAHMPAERWGKDHDKRLAEYCAENGIDISQVDKDALASEVLEEFRMEAGHIFSAPAGFVLEAFPVQEIETDLDGLFRDPESGVDYSLAMAVADRCDSCIAETSFAYTTTDAVWFAVISTEQIREIAARLHEEGMLV